MEHAWLLDVETGLAVCPTWENGMEACFGVFVGPMLRPSRIMVQWLRSGSSGFLLHQRLPVSVASAMKSLRQ